jgi:RHS repeat-associated protein
MAATYTYDALGRRIGIDDSGTQTWTVYNGKSADANPYADFTSSGALKMRYLDGLAVDEILAQTDASGDTSWYLTDQLGSVVAIASTSAVLDQIVYDPFGNIVTQTNATDAVRFGFAGMEYDSVTGLYYDHARYYDAVIGRFVSPDPMGFSAGDTNLYRYVGNDPTNAVDSSGQQEKFTNDLDEYKWLQQKEQQWWGVWSQVVGVIERGGGFNLTPQLEDLYLQSLNNAHNYARLQTILINRNILNWPTITSPDQQDVQKLQNLNNGNIIGEEPVDINTVA